ncbi:MAG: type I restriction enzyme HsdR N-terminal domain-containing protein [Salibacteraceae bacterium]
MKAKVRRDAGSIQIFDQNRGKYIVLTPEEWVRQHFIHFINRELQAPLSNIQTEFSVKYGMLRKRPDILVLKEAKNPWLIVECKAPSVSLTNSTMDQALTYFSILKPNFIALTNGIDHFYFSFQPELEKFVSIKDLPRFK